MSDASTPFYQTAAFKKLQRKWYAKAKKSGHRDVEHWGDMNLHSTSTLRRFKSSPGAVSFCSLEGANGDSTHSSQHDRIDELLEKAEYHAVHETPTAQAWRKFAHAANELSSRDHRKGLLLTVSEAGYIRKSALRRHGLRRETAMRIVHGFLKEIGLPVTGLLGKGSHDRKAGTE